MYLLENALQNVFRNKGRNILIGAVIFAVIVTTVIALMINNTAGSIIDDYKSRFDSEVRLQPNTEKLQEEAMKNSTDGRFRIMMPSLDADQYIAYGQSEYLAGSVYTSTAGAISDGSLTAVAAELGGGSGMVRIGGGPGAESEEEVPPMEYYFNMKGNQFSEFESGTRTLTDGSKPIAELGLNECYISTELAELNGTQIGDTFTFTGEQRNREDNSVEYMTYTLTVAGLYYDLTDEYAGMTQQNAYTNRRNEVLTTYETVAQPYVSGLNGIRISGTFYLKAPSMLEAYTAELRAKGLPEVFDVTTDTATYEAIVTPVENLTGIAVTFMLVVLVFGGIIIALLSSIAIRERKYEIGVLRAMGLKKGKVAFGLWSEMLMVTLCCLILGLSIGPLAAQPVTDLLLDKQVEAAKSAQSQPPSGGFGGRGGMMNTMMFGGQAAVSAEPLSEIDLSLGWNTAAQIAGISLLLASLAALIAISRITKYEPIKILMERN